MGLSPRCRRLPGKNIRAFTRGMGFVRVSMHYHVDTRRKECESDKVNLVRPPQFCGRGARPPIQRGAYKPTGNVKPRTWRLQRLSPFPDGDVAQACKTDVTDLWYVFQEWLDYQVLRPVVSTFDDQRGTLMFFKQLIIDRL